MTKAWYDARWIAALKAHRVDHAVYAAISSFNNTQTGTCFPSRAKIAAVAGVDQRTVTSSIARLVAIGALRVEQRSGRSSVYHLEPWYAATQGDKNPGAPQSRTLVDPALDTLVDGIPAERTKERVISPNDDVDGKRENAAQIIRQALSDCNLTDRLDAETRSILNAIGASEAALFADWLMVSGSARNPIAHAITMTRSKKEPNAADVRCMRDFRARANAAREFNIPLEIKTP